MNARNAALAAIAAISLIGLGCNREHNERYGKRDYDQNTAQRTNQSGHDNADTNKLNDKYDNLADHDATGMGHRYEISKVDSKSNTITLTRVSTDQSGATTKSSNEDQRQLQSGSDVTLSFDDFDRYAGPTQSVKAKDLKEHQVVSVFRDASGNISKIVETQDKKGEQKTGDQNTGY